MSVDSQRKWRDANREYKRKIDREYRRRRRANATPEEKEAEKAYNRVYHRQYQRTHPQIRDAVRYGQYQAAYARQERILHPKRVAARILARKAIARGDIVRKPCEVCGSPRTHAHHDDYDRPLDVRFLCSFHHRNIHPKTQ